MCDISYVVEGADQVDFEDLKDLSVSDIECYKYALQTPRNTHQALISTRPLRSNTYSNNSYKLHIPQDSVNRSHMNIT
jgi:hypothetical protein